MIKRLVSLFVIFSLATPVLSGVKSFVGAYRDDVFLYVVAGLDDANENMDVLFFLEYYVAENSVTIAQIPRDTYCRYDGKDAKINEIYSHHKALGLNKKEASAKACEIISELFRVETDGYLFLDSTAFRKAVDNMGGVTVNMPRELVIERGNGKAPLVLKKGKNKLSGADALKFVRHRKSYPAQDLQRLDAEKIFIDGFVETLFSTLDQNRALPLAFGLQRDSVTNISLGEILAVALKHSSKFKKLSMTYMTLPGEALVSYGGVSYYSLNRDGTDRALSEYIHSYLSDFDEDKRFLKDNEKAFAEIYYRLGMDFKVYTSDNLPDI